MIAVEFNCSDIVTVRTPEAAHMLKRRAFLAGLAALPALAGSATVTQAAVTPNCAAPAAPIAFDPVAFIVEMRGIGAALTLDPRTATFAITGRDGRGIPGSMCEVSNRWDPAISLEPDWIGRVFRVLMAERPLHDPSFNCCPMPTVGALEASHA